MDIRKLLGLLAKQADETLPAVRKNLPEVAEEADELLPAIRKTTLPTEVAPEVLGKGTSKAVPRSGSIIDAETIAPKVSTMDAIKQFAKENPGKITGGLTLAEIARQMMSGGDTIPPMMTPPPVQAKGVDDSVIKESQLPSLPTKKQAPAQELSATDQARAGMDKFMANIPQDVPQAPVQPEGPNFLKMMEDAQSKQEKGLNEANLLRASENLGAGFARIAPEHGSSDIKRKEAERFGEQTKNKVAAIKEQQMFDKAEQEVDDDKALRDPNSNISKLTAERLAKYGINVKTAAEAKQLNPQIFNLLLADRAQENARKVAAMGLEVKSQKEEKELDNKQRKFARDLRKEATSGVLGKQYATFSTGQRMGSALAEFSRNPSGYKDYATLMGGLKTLQGDESVVREAEMRLGINATSLINKAKNYLDMAATGKSLQPSQRKEMLDTINTLTQVSRDQYMQSVAPILEQAEMEGIPSSMILSGSLGAGDDSDKKGAQVQYSPKEEAGIANYAKVKGISREEAISKLKDGGRLK